ncbi:MAG: glutathione S-transferase family protein [Pseudomonadota bacterium]
MGMVVNGQWQDKPQPVDEAGNFRREDAKFRNWITSDGSAGPHGEGGFKAEPDRYHLYVSLACPWAHRTLMMRAFKGLERMIDVSVVHWEMREHGWTFADGEDVVADPIHNAKFMHQVYTAAKADYTGKVTVPTVWDKQKGTIASNESSEIIRMFNSAFDGVGARPGDYYPEALRAEIDRVNTRVYHDINNGVYKSGFAKSQAAYDKAVTALFDALDWAEDLLGERRYMAGDTFTEADIRLFTTLIRFDPVYHTHFKCNKRRLSEFPRLWALTKEIYAMPGVAETTNFDHIRRHYYESHLDINPMGIVPLMPEMDLSEVSGVQRLSA